jgi:thiol-disulfide isomerase/thioredoxin
MAHRSPTLLCARGLGVALALALLAGPPAKAAPRDLRIEDLSGAPRSLASLAGRPVVMILWRSDCGPCLVELQGLRGLQSAAAPAAVVTLSLDETAAPARRALAKLDAHPRYAWRSLEPGGKVLTDLNGAPPRLPLAVAFDRKGALCARHLGLLGTERVQAWARQCDRPKAG